MLQNMVISITGRQKHFTKVYHHIVLDNKMQFHVTDINVHIDEVKKNTHG